MASASTKSPNQHAPLSQANGAGCSINDTKLNRWVTLLAIKILKSMRPRKGSVLMLTDRVCVKYGKRLQVSEASTMRFIAENTTSLPVPKVLCAFTHKNKDYIVMERINGKMLADGWVWRSEESKSKLLAQLKAMIEEMRRIEPPEGTRIASVDDGPLFDCRVPGTSLCFGPFDTLRDFHRHVRRGMDFERVPDQEIQDNPIKKDIQYLMREHEEKSWPLVFTHGDLSSLNILARGDEIVGIVDWETAGWYPSYWEYTTACQVNPQNSFWIHEIDKFLQPFPEELGMERIRQKYFGDI